MDRVWHRVWIRDSVLLQSNPYTDGIEAECLITQEMIEKYNLDKVELDQLVSAVNASSVALAVEMYIAGFLDGGHVAMAFHKREMPGEE